MLSRGHRTSMRRFMVAGMVVASLATPAAGQIRIQSDPYFEQGWRSGAEAERQRREAEAARERQIRQQQHEAEMQRQRQTYELERARQSAPSPAPAAWVLWSQDANRAWRPVLGFRSREACIERMPSEAGGTCFPDTFDPRR